MKDAGRTWFTPSSSKLLVITFGLILLNTETSTPANISSSLLEATPSEFRYPYHTAPNQIKDEIIILTNTGDVAAGWSASTENGFITFTGATNGVCEVGSSNAGELAFRVTGPTIDGFYAGTIDITYFDVNKSPQTVLSIPVDLYNFTDFYLPTDAAIRTNLVRMNVNQASEIANADSGNSFTYFAEGSNYIRDGYLILGNSAENLSYSTFGGGGSSGAPTASNPYGYLYAASQGVVYGADSTGLTGTRHASGKGYNRDSTLAFTCDYFAPKHPDSANFMVLRYSIYKGPNDPTGTVNNLTVAYYVDADVPADINLENLAGFDTTVSPNATRRNMIYQRGTPASSANNNQNRFLAVGGRTHQGFPPIGGFAVPNPIYIYPQSGWENDSLWNRMQSLVAPVGVSGGDYEIDPSNSDPGGTPEDLSMVVVYQRGATVRGDTTGTGPDTLKVAVAVAGTNSSGSLNTLNGVMDRVYKYIRLNKIIHCKCGDADGSGLVNISDAIRLINFIFGNLPSPNPLCRGDSDGNGAINVSDAVKILGYIFSGASAPAGC
jgi:hypothetical protein